MKKMESSEITDRLNTIPLWTRNGNRIQRSLEFNSFLLAIEFINLVADRAESADHHPEIFNVYTRVELVLTTHDADGITEKDFELASEIDQAVDFMHTSLKSK